jgi:hypothetical protein
MNPVCATGQMPIAALFLFRAITLAMKVMFPLTVIPSDQRL